MAGFVGRILAGGLVAAAALGPVAATEDPFLEAYGETFRFRLGRPGGFQLTPDGKTLLFRRGTARAFEQDLWTLRVADGRESRLYTADQILGGADEQLTEAEKARRERQRLSTRGITSFELMPDGKHLLIPLSGKLYLATLDGGGAREIGPSGGAAIDPRLSPDGKRIAFARDREVHVMDVADGRVRALTRDAPDGVSRGEAEFVAQEEMSRNHGLWWSPDSKWLVYQETDTSHLEVMKIMDSVRPDREPSRWPYPRPGKDNARVRLGILSAAGGATRWIEWDRQAFEYVASVRWHRKGGLTVLVQNRRQTEQRLLAVDPKTGRTRTLLTERDDAWVEIDQSVPLWLADGSGFLWTTEREGRLQLELRDRDGKPRRFLTDAAFGFAGIEFLDEKRKRVLVRAAADPTQTGLWWVPLERGKARRVSDQPGVYNAHGSGLPFVVEDTGPDRDRRWRIFDGDGPTGVAVRSVQEQPPVTPRPEFVTVGEERKLHAVVLRPKNFVEDREYPVIVHVYGGPTSQMVQRDRSRYALAQWMSDRGFIVVSIDGRGTPRRDRAWTRAVKHDLIEKPLQDQVDGLRALGERFPEMDLERVGIFGWSFGGYFSAMAVMRRPDVFRVGVAGAPVVDWLDYDTHYTERYMDLPQLNEQGYDASNVLTYAKRLERPLMLIHGTADDNVYLVHSLKLSDHLIRAGKRFEFLPLPGHTHSVRDPEMVVQVWSRAFGFLRDHLAPLDR